jgi:hypothetical protein
MEGGVDISMIPREELVSGKGPIVTTYLHWIRMVKSGDTRATRLNELLALILQWRKTTASKLQVVPSVVMLDHVARKIAYTQPTSLEALHTCGVRIATAAELIALVSKWKDRHDDGVKRCLEENDELIDVPDGFKVQKPIPLTSIKSTPWQASWERFQIKHERPDVIAVDQPSGRPIQTATVVSHLLKALSHGNVVDLKRLLETSNIAITLADWNKCSEAFDIVGCTNETKVKDVLRVILGGSVDNESPTDQDRALFAAWYAKLRVIHQLLLHHVPVSNAKRARV